MYVQSFLCWGGSLKLIGKGFWCDLLTGENFYTHIKASPEFEPHFFITVYALR